MVRIRLVPEAVVASVACPDVESPRGLPMRYRTQRRVFTAPAGTFAL